MKWGAVGENQTTREAAEQVVNAFGVTVLIQVETVADAPGLADQLIKRLTEAWVDSPIPDGEATEQLVVNLGQISEEQFEQVHSNMSTQVTLAALKSHAGRSLLFHAGGIAREDGRVAIVVGPSGRGKTTTMRQLGQHYGYVSDETIAITPDGVVLPYRKPLSVITKGHDHKLQIRPSQLNLLPLPDAPLQLGGIAVLERAPEGENASTVTHMGFAAGIVAVIEQSSYLIDLDRPLARVSEAAAAVGGFKILTVGTPESIYEVAEDLFLAGTTPRWERVMPEAPATHSEDTAYVPADIVDAVECEDGTVVFSRARQVMLLDGIGPQLWRAACEGEDWNDLVSRIESVHGPAPDTDTRKAIEQVGEQLITAGVLKNIATAQTGETR